MSNKTNQKEKNNIFCFTIIILLAFTSASHMALGLPPYDPPYEIIRVTNNNYDNIDPQISGNNIVWQGGYYGSTQRIYFWDGSQVTTVASNSYEDLSPQISGTNVVWQGLDPNDGDGAIFFWDGSTTTQITNNDTGDGYPQISGDNVVWQGRDPNDSDSEIFFWNGSSIIQVTDNSDYDYTPQISGTNVVWRGLDPNDGDSEIFFWNGSSITQVTDNTYNDSRPQISGNNVVWEGSPGGGFTTDTIEIFFWNGSSVIQVTNNSHSDTDPQISGNNVVWRGQPGGIGADTEIFFWDGNTITQITDNSDHEYGAQISGDNVVWYGRDGGDYNKIFFWNSNTVTQVTDNSDGDVGPQISGSNVVWISDDGHDLEIFFAPWNPLIRGRKWRDANDNYLLDAEEKGLADWRIFADLNEDGQFDPSEPNAITDDNGNYELILVTDTSSVRIVEEKKNCWEQTYPGAAGAHIVRIVPGEAAENINFGNARPTEIYPSAWSQNEQDKLLAIDGNLNDSFGQAVSISDRHALIGSPKDDDHGTDSGSAYIFEPNDNNCNEWNQVAKLTAPDGANGDQFGTSISMSGNYALVGASGDDDMATGAGAAYLFYRHEGGLDNWGLQAKLTASDGDTSDFFGESVSIHGDYAIVGTRWNDDMGDNSGSAYLFYRNEGGPDNWGEQAKLTASDGTAGDYFGSTVSINGDTAIIGTYGDDDNGEDSGSAYIFYRNKGGLDNWGEQAKLLASDGTTLNLFGTSVSIYGDYALIGAYYDNDNGSGSGSAYVFHRNEGGDDNWGQQAKLIASDAAASDFFGRSVALYGDFALIGAHYDDDKGDNSGSAYIFERDGSTWNQKVKLTALDGAADDYYGSTVSIDGTYAIVGSYGDDDKGSYSGAAYVLGKVLCPTMDLTGDCFVGLEDLAIFAAQWLEGVQ